MGRTQQIVRFSIILGAAALIRNTGACWLTGSAALFPGALKTAVKMAATRIAGIADRPADANRFHGHG